MTNYPLLDLFLTMMWLFIWLMWLFLLIRVVLDIFRSDDIGGGQKALWLVLVIILPYLGVLIYVIARGGGMGRRDVRRAQQADEDFRRYVQTAAGSPGVADQLTKLAALRDSGVLTEEEFAAQKAKLIA